MYGDINGGYGGSGRRAVGPADFYRRVPPSMTEATRIGVIMSIISLLLMTSLFLCETYEFARPRMKSSIELDNRDASWDEALLRLNFNVSLFDVHCEFVSVDVWDSLGTNLQNITKDVTKYHIDRNGEQASFHGRNREQARVDHEVHEETLKDIADANGGELHSIDITPENRRDTFESWDVVFVDYFAPWCLWCQRLAPTWEKFAEQVAKRHVQLGVAKVDCVAHAQLCKDERIMAFPTLRWYEHGQAVMPDYKGDRTVNALVEYATRRLGEGLEDESEDHHPGCQVSGHLMVNRVPGNLHMEAKSIHHEINSAMTNLTHRVDHLSFGDELGPQGHFLDRFAFLNGIPDEFKHTNPMRGRLFQTHRFHESFHHHLKVVTTTIDYLFRPMALYQILAESQLVLYELQEVPEIKFLWDMSPMGIEVDMERRPWYDYLTTCLAIVGGAYVSLGLVNRALLAMFKPKRL